MNYIVQEIQTNQNATALITPEIFSDRNQADARFFTILAAAAVSNVEEHAVIMYTNDGKIIRCDGYTHESQ